MVFGYYLVEAVCSCIAFACLKCVCGFVNEDASTVCLQNDCSTGKGFSPATFSSVKTAKENPKENPKEEAEFNIGQRLFQWVKWTSVGIGLGGTTLYVAKECHKVGRKRIPHPASPGRRNRRAYSSDSE